MATLYSICEREPPAYSVIKDLFDQIDIRKDGIIDFTEWSKTFLSAPDPSYRQIYQNGSYDMSSWVHTKEYNYLIICLSRNRKMLEKMFRQKSNDPTFIDSAIGKQIVKDYIKVVLKNDGIEDWKVDALMTPFNMMRRGEIEMNF